MEHYPIPCEPLPSKFAQLLATKRAELVLGTSLVGGVPAQQQALPRSEQLRMKAELAMFLELSMLLDERGEE